MYTWFIVHLVITEYYKKVEPKPVSECRRKRFIGVIWVEEDYNLKTGHALAQVAIRFDEVAKLLATSCYA